MFFENYLNDVLKCQKRAVAFIFFENYLNDVLNLVLMYNGLLQLRRNVSVSKKYETGFWCTNVCRFNLRFCGNWTSA